MPPLEPTDPALRQADTPETPRRPIVLACSPRPDGNCDRAADLFAHNAPGENGWDTHFLRQYRVSPCIACGSCERAARKAQETRTDPLSLESFADKASPAFSYPFACPLTELDDSARMLHMLCSAPAVCVVAPVYFYHLPALFKALIDRTQSLWAMRNNGVRLFSAPARPCFVILLGARLQGKKLFEGSLLSLTYSLPALNLTIQDPLLLYGLDARDDLAKNQDARHAIAHYAAAAHFNLR